MITRRKTNPDITKNFKRRKRDFKSKDRKTKNRKIKKFAELLIKESTK